MWHNYCPVKKVRVGRPTSTEIIFGTRFNAQAVSETQFVKRVEANASRSRTPDNTHGTGVAFRIPSVTRVC